MDVVLMVAANLSITSAYWFIAKFIAPGFALPEWSRIGAVGFFFLCGLTHIEISLHILFFDGFTVDDLTSWHALFIHIPQAFAVWLFVFGLSKVKITQMSEGDTDGATTV